VRTLSAALKTVLANGPPYVLADLWTITLSNGTVLHWTSSQQALTVGGTAFNVGPPIQRDTVTFKLGLGIDELKLTVTDDGGTLINGTPIVTAAWQNMFDLAEVRLDRFVSDSWSNTAVGSTEYFTGLVGDVSVHGKTVELTVESALAQLKATFPRTYQLPQCSNTLYDGVCGLLAANFTSSGTVGAGASARSFTLSGVSKPDGYFTLGKIKFTSGANAGQVRQVKDYTGGVVTLAYPLYQVPAQGDALDAIAGCDKTRPTCNGTFNNITHFRGFPYIPDPNDLYTGQGGGGSSGGNGGGGGGGGSGGGMRKRPGAGGGLMMR